MKDITFNPLGLTTGNMMKRSDFIALGTLFIVISVFAFIPGALSGFKHLSKEYAYSMSFVKFAVLATFGECLALRITSGCYNKAGFGVLPKMIIWGLLGILIKGVFVLFTTGAPNVLASLGFAVDTETIRSGSFGMRLLTAFSISLCMNLIFAPVMMTLHKITDLHINEWKGSVSALVHPIDVARILGQIDWQVMYHYVFKKTIPFFWIPAHTITFLLPGEFQVLFAATLGIALGLILAFAATR